MPQGTNGRALAGARTARYRARMGSLRSPFGRRAMWAAAFRLVDLERACSAPSTSTSGRPTRASRYSRRTPSHRDGRFVPFGPLTVRLLDRAPISLRARQVEKVTGRARSRNVAIVVVHAAMIIAANPWVAVTTACRLPGRSHHQLQPTCFLLDLVSVSHASRYPERSRERESEATRSKPSWCRPDSAYCRLGSTRTSCSTRCSRSPSWCIAAPPRPTGMIVRLALSCVARSTRPGRMRSYTATESRCSSRLWKSSRSAR